MVLEYKKAYHESGHTVVAYLIGILISQVMIRPSGLTITSDIVNLHKRIQNKEPLAIEFAKAKIVLYLAGEIAQFREIKEHDPIGASTDQSAINSLLYTLYPYPSMELYARDRDAYNIQYSECTVQQETLKATLNNDAESLITFGWTAVNALAQKLVEVKKLDGADVEQLILAHLPPKSSWADLNWLDTSEPGALFYTGELLSS